MSLLNPDLTPGSRAHDFAQLLGAHWPAATALLTAIILILAVRRRAPAGRAVGAALLSAVALEAMVLPAWPATWPVPGLMPLALVASALTVALYLALGRIVGERR